MQIIKRNDLNNLLFKFVVRNWIKYRFLWKENSEPSNYSYRFSISRINNIVFRIDGIWVKLNLINKFNKSSLNDNVKINVISKFIK